MYLEAVKGSISDTYRDFKTMKLNDVWNKILLW